MEGDGTGRSSVLRQDQQRWRSIDEIRPDFLTEFLQRVRDRHGDEKGEYTGINGYGVDDGAVDGGDDVHGRSAVDDGVSGEAVDPAGLSWRGKEATRGKRR